MCSITSLQLGETLPNIAKVRSERKNKVMQLHIVINDITFLCILLSAQDMDTYSYTLPLGK